VHAVRCDPFYEKLNKASDFVFFSPVNVFPSLVLTTWIKRKLLGGNLVGSEFVRGTLVVSDRVSINLHEQNSYVPDSIQSNHTQR
jgi:hypothetical protein